MTQMSGMGGGLDLSGPPSIHESANVDANSILGDHSYVGPNCEIIGCECGSFTFLYSEIRMVCTHVGNFFTVAKNARINAEQHPYKEFVTSHNFSYFGERMYHLGHDDEEYLARRRANVLTIGSDVWVGHGGVIQMGVKNIGHGAVIGANAVVTHDVEPYQIVAGVPARPIGYRFDKEIIDALLRIQWWDWPEEDIWARVDDLKDVPAFCKKYDPQP